MNKETNFIIDNLKATWRAVGKISARTPYIFFEDKFSEWNKDGSKKRPQDIKYLTLLDELVVKLLMYTLFIPVTALKPEWTSYIVWQFSGIEGKDRYLHILKDGIEKRKDSLQDIPDNNC
ncbi:hypothetical protein H3C65_04090 [Patescibacteria group bacterium]|nr:hypothetical protein [Patescibacteria group bacterium]